MKNLNDFPRLRLGLLPTPLHRLDNVSRLLGKNIYVKRDDLTGVGLGGNKVRKLEYLLAQAQAQGADYVLTTGGAQSNHAMLTAACVNKLGMKAILILKKKGVTAREGNQLLNDLLGAEVRFLDTPDYADIYAEMERISAELAARGHKAYCIPVGGSVPLGSLGYVNGMREAAEQAAALGVRFDRIVCATGSGGTHAGVALGARIYFPGARVVGMAVDTEPFAEIVPRLIRETAALLAYDLPAGADAVELVDMTGPGYAIPSEAGNAAVRLMAESEGIILDPVYTGKAFAGLVEQCRSGAFADAENILFLHTGGAGGLFALGRAVPAANCASRAS